MRDPKRTTYHYQKRVQQLPGVTPEILQELLADPVTVSRIVTHRDERGIIEYWMIPKKLAERYGMEYHTDLYDEEVGWYLCDDGYIGWVSRFNVNRTMLMREAGEHEVYVLGPLVKGYAGWGRQWLVYHRSQKFLAHDTDVGFNTWGYYRGGWNEKEFGPDPRKRTFVELFFASNDAEFAYMEAYNVDSCWEARKRARRLLKEERVKQLMDDILRSKIEKVFADRGISESAEGWVVEQMMDIIEVASQSEKTLGIALKGLGDLADILQMKKEDKVVTTETLTLELSNEDKKALTENKKRMIAERKTDASD